MRETPPPLEQVEMSEKDIEFAERIAKQLGYEQTAYTSSSQLWGLFCLPKNPARPENRGKPHRGGCVIKTRNLGFLFVAGLEELQLHTLADAERRQWKAEQKGVCV